MEMKLKIDIKNIGPHRNLSFSDNCGCLRMALFASNGSGKSFISRMFRLTENDSNEILNQNLLTFKETEGSFSFHVENQDDPVLKDHNLDITIKDGKLSVNNNSNFIFHTFNSDFVESNLSVYNSNVDKIEGVILGKVNIDITEEKKGLESKTEEKSIIEDKLKDALKSIIQQLDSLSINKNTNEYKLITFENLITEKLGQEEETFSDLKKKQTLLKNMPDYDDLENVNRLDDFKLEHIEELLCTEYSQGTISEEFKREMSRKEDFVTSGLKLYNENKEDPTCPFCHQKLESTSDVITKYVQYFEDTETKIRQKIKQSISEINLYLRKIETAQNKYDRISKKYTEIASNLPSITEKNIRELKDLLTEPLSLIISELEKKSSNLADTLFDITQLKENFSSQQKIYNENIQLINKQINLLNKTKNDIKTEKLTLNKRLCVSSFNEFIKKSKEEIETYKNLLKDIDDINNIIKEKENEAKQNKKEKVIADLKKYLNFFFEGKYIFDEEQFCLKYSDEFLKSNINYVLSDGEKSIVAFCYYLAMTHNLVSSESDYNRLFFIIDDPISSMDFHYVYAVSQLIRKLDVEFYSNNNQKVKCLILTHNMEFMTILVSNKIVGKNYILANSKISNLKNDLIMPYEAHLRDIYDISKNKLDPTHTTANSIRHILETINKFKYPTKNFEDFFDEISELKEHEYLYSIIQDCSHGRIRTQIPFEKSMIVQGCEKVIEYVRSECPGQISKLEGMI